jgi:hypothetical protein
LNPLGVDVDAALSQKTTEISEALRAEVKNILKSGKISDRPASLLEYASKHISELNLKELQFIGASMGSENFFDHEK